MKIAFTVEDFRPWRGGGEGYVFSLATALRDRGHEIAVFAGEIEGALDGIALHKVPFEYGVSRRAAFARACARLLEKRRGEFDLVHGFGKSLYMDVFRPGGGVHRAWQEMEPRSVEGGLRRWCRGVRRKFSLDQRAVLQLEAGQFRGGPDGPEIICNSRRVRDHARRYYDVPDERLHVIYNGVDTARFSPVLRDKHRSTTRDDWGIKNDEVVVLFAANNFRLKGLRPLIRAAGRIVRRHRNIKFVVLGRGRERAYRRLASSLGCADALHFAGPTRAPEQAYAAADILAHPTFYDPCANVTLEALASGLPVITSTCNGAGELIEDGIQGRVCEPDDVDAIAGALIEFADAERRLSAGTAARALAERHTVAQHVDEILTVYRRALARKQQ